MKLLTKLAIFGAADLKHEDVAVPQWGGTVRVRMMTGLERDEFRAALAVEGGVPVGQMAAVLVASACIDDQGERMFSLDEVEALRKKSATALDTLAAVAMRLNGLGAVAVEAAEKNSESGQSGDSGSDSPKS